MSTTTITKPKQSRISFHIQSIEARLKNLKGPWRDFRANPLSKIGIFLIFIFGTMVVLHPILLSTIWTDTLYDPYLGFDESLIPHPAKPSLRHIFGTDALGRDVFSQLLYGAKMSFMVGITAAFISVLFSTIFGGIAGYFGGVIDVFLMGVSDVFVLLPALIVLLIIGLLIRMDWLLISVVYGVLTGLGSQAIVVKSQALSIKNPDLISRLPKSPVVTVDTYYSSTSCRG